MSRLSISTNVGGLADAQGHRNVLARLADYVELTKPRIVAMELITVIVAAHLASPRGVDRGVLLFTVFGAALVAASAGAFNQWWERATDARMPRTAKRPLPGGRLTSRSVLLFGAATLLLGVAAVAVGANPLAASMALATWIIYVLAYTPMKSRSPLNTAVGAASGALPILIGWTATGAAIDTRALAVVAAMFLWQFPHFMAIAWLYRHEYANAGQQMLTVVDPTGLRAGAQAVVGAMVLIPVSLVPALAPQPGSPVIYCGWTIVLGLAHVAVAAMFLLHRSDDTARWLLRASLAYLICWMGLLLMVAV
jgi:protoheme IX farnesyltransferase